MSGDVRYVVVGPGAVGGAIGGRLFQHGHDVVLVARGEHGRALAERGLELQSPEAGVTLPVPAVSTTADVTWRAGAADVVVLATKTHDTDAAVRELAAVAPPDVTVGCAQTGVETERIVLRRFARVQAMCVMLPATHLEPGVVQVSSAPLTGILDLGRYPAGTDAVTERIAADLETARFSARPDPAIMRRKYRKLVMNLGNAIEAACGHGSRGGELLERAVSEAMACFDAAGIDVASAEEDRERRGDLLQVQPVMGARRGGGSSWQSLARGTGTIETDFLNGEIVLLGRLQGVPPPVNALLQRTAGRLARDRIPPGSLSADELLAELG
jgi:2-dehydropantoate 2-reductase